jgi:hypothetical protein
LLFFLLNVTNIRKQVIGNPKTFIQNLPKTMVLHDLFKRVDTFGIGGGGDMGENAVGNLVHREPVSLHTQQQQQQYCTLSYYLPPQWINRKSTNGAMGGRVIGDAVPFDLWKTNCCCEPFINRFGKVKS